MPKLDLGLIRMTKFRRFSLPSNRIKTAFGRFCNLSLYLDVRTSLTILNTFLSIFKPSKRVREKEERQGEGEKEERERD